MKLSREGGIRVLVGIFFGIFIYYYEFYILYFGVWLLFGWFYWIVDMRVGRNFIDYLV